MSEGSGSDHAASRQDGSSAGPSGAPDGFSPAGLKVLVVDDDLMCLKVVSAMLQRCSYEVTTSSNGNDALALLRERHEDNSADQFDLVLSDVYMPDMDGFKLLEHIGLELDLPVIMMSSNGDTNVVLRGVTHGAVDFLIKPVRIEELRNVWQHVVRRRSMALARHTEESAGAGSDDDSVARGRNHGVKRKESEASPLQLSTEPGGSKKPRVVWSVEMHQQFVNAVNTLGIDKAVPKRILDLMNVEGLTRENVASHLQKYRLYLKRVEGVQCGGGSKSHKNGRNQEQPPVAASQPATAAAALQAGAYGGLPAAAALQKQQQAAAVAAVAAMGAGVQGMPPQGLPPGLLGIGPPPPTALPPTMHQAMAMQAAAAAAAASGALPGSMPPPFMPPGMVAPGVPGGMPGLGPMMGQPPVMPGMDMSALTGFGNGMMFAQHAQQAAAPPASMPQLASLAGPSLPPASMSMCPPVSSGDVLQGLALPPQNAAAAAVAAAAAQQQHSGGGGGLLGPGCPSGMSCQIPAIPGSHTSALLGDETPDLQEQRLLPPTTQEAPLTLGGCFATEDPLGSGNPLGEMTFLGELGAAGVKAEPDDFLDLFLKDSMNEEL